MKRTKHTTSTFESQYRLDRIRDTLRQFYEQCEKDAESRAVQPPIAEHVAEHIAVQCVERVGDTEEKVAPKKEYRGNQYDLDQFNYRQSQIQYYASLSKTKKDIRPVEKVMVEFNQEEFDKRRYLKKWNRLDDYAKQVVAKTYLEKLLETERITQQEYTRLVKEVRQLIVKRELKRVEYDEGSGILYEIAQLSLPSIR
jgi:hypothetical protein